jgi:hypothetical protein
VLELELDKADCSLWLNEDGPGGPLSAVVDMTIIIRVCTRVSKAGGDLIIQNFLFSSIENTVVESTIQYNTIHHELIRMNQASTLRCCTFPPFTALAQEQLQRREELPNQHPLAKRRQRQRQLQLQLQPHRQTRRASQISQRDHLAAAKATPQRHHQLAQRLPLIHHPP